MATSAKKAKTIDELQVTKAAKAEPAAKKAADSEAVPVAASGKKSAAAKKPKGGTAVENPVAASDAPKKTALNPAGAWPFPTGIRPK